MTEKDKQLIALAEEMKHTNWGAIWDLEKEAESEEAVKELERLARWGSLREEYEAGIL